MPQDDEVTAQKIDFVAYQRRRDARKFLKDLAGAEALSALTVDANASKSVIQLALEALDRIKTISSYQVSAVTSVEIKRQIAPVKTEVLVERFDVTMGLNEQFVYLLAHGDTPIAERTVVFQVDRAFYATAQSQVILPNTLPDDVGSIFPYAAKVHHTRYIFSPPVAPMTPHDAPRRSIR